MASHLVGQNQIATFATPVNGTRPIDANQVRGNDNSIKTAYNFHDLDPTLHIQDSTEGARPVAGVEGRKWMTVDGLAVRLWFDTGTAWQELSYIATGTGGTFTAPVSFIHTSPPQITVGWDATHAATMAVDATGLLTFTNITGAVGAAPGFKFDNPVSVNGTLVATSAINNASYASGTSTGFAMGPLAGVQRIAFDTATNTFGLLKADNSGANLAALGATFGAAVSIGGALALSAKVTITGVAGENLRFALGGATALGDANYMTWYRPDATRRAYLGIVSGNDPHMAWTNEASSGGIFLSAAAGVTVTPTGVTNPILLRANESAPSFGALSFNNATGTSTGLGLTGSTTTLFIVAPAGGSFDFRVGGANSATLSATSWVVSGAIQAGGAWYMAAGQKFFMDGGFDTYIWQNTDNRISAVAGTVNALEIFTDGPSIQPTHKFYLDGHDHTYISEIVPNQIALVAAGSQTLLVQQNNIVVQKDIVLVSGMKFYVDGGGDTYAYEGAANETWFVSGGIVSAKFGDTWARMAGTAPIAMGNSTGSYPLIGYNFAPTNVGGGWKYVGADVASGISFSANNFVFYMATTGSAGAGITWGEYFRIGTTAITIVNSILPSTDITCDLGTAALRIRQTFTQFLFVGAAAYHYAISNSHVLHSSGTDVFVADKAVGANEVGLQVFDVTAASLRRVTIGAANSGGSGFRYLRIPN